MEQILFDFIAQYMPLTDEEKQTIIELSIFHSFEKGIVLLKEGQYSDEGYFVLKGCIRSYQMVDGEEKTTEFFTEMQGLNPTCAVTGNASEYFVACVEDSILLIYNPEMEQITFQKFPRFETLCRIMSEKLLVESQVKLNEFKTTTPEQRYFHMLETRPDLIQRVPQYQLASYLGITPQSLSRLRGRIVKKS